MSDKESTQPATNDILNDVEALSDYVRNILELITQLATKPTVLLIGR
jgi:hypothetical protein